MERRSLTTHASLVYSSNMANPRKFAEKIALHTQKQEEETRAFEQIMKEVTMLESSIKSQHQQLQPHYRGGSLPNVNLSLTHAQNHIDLQNALNSLDDLKVRHNLTDRIPARHGRFQGSRPLPMNTSKRFGGIDTSPYHTGCHLSPPQHLDGWRRTASDSALHSSVMHSEVKPKEINVNKLPSNSFETRTMHGSPSRPKSCEVPGIKIYPSSEQASLSGPALPISSNTGSLPDLTNLHIPSPLQTPIDTDEQGNQTVSPSHPFPLASTRQGMFRRQPVNQQPLRKSPYSHQMPMMDANISPLENRLQQFQFYPQMNSQGNSGIPVTSGGSPTMSPTPSSPLTPFFGNLPPSSMSDLYFKQQPPQQQQPSTFALQQQLEQFSMHHPVGSMIGSTGQLPFQSLLAQSTSSMPPGMAGLAHLYSSHSRVPDLIVTGTEDDGHKSDFAKDLSMAMANVGEDAGDMYGADDPLKVVLDPLDVEGIQMLSGQEPELTDAATEDTFRMDRLGAAGLH